MSKELATYEGVRSLLGANMKNISAVITSQIDEKVLCAVALNSFRKVPKLRECTPASILNAIIQAAQMNLPIDGRLAHLIPYGKEATLIIDYKGFIHLAKNSGEIKKVCAEIVYMNEINSGDFVMTRGTHPSIVHNPQLTGDKGDVAGAYAVVTLADGDVDFEWMDIDELKKIRKSSKSPDSPAYMKWESEMQKKAVIKRLLKRMTLTPELEKAVDLNHKVAMGATTRDISFGDEIVEDFVDAESEVIDIEADADFFYAACAKAILPPDDDTLANFLEVIAIKHGKSIPEMAAEYGRSFRQDVALKTIFFDSFIDYQLKWSTCRDSDVPDLATHDQKEICIALHVTANPDSNKVEAVKELEKIVKRSIDSWTVADVENIKERLEGK